MFPNKGHMKFNTGMFKVTAPYKRIFFTPAMHVILQASQWNKSAYPRKKARLAAM
jgi:hypothetical protein